MSIRHEENDIYIIPPNFIDTGTVFGGTIKLRNAAEALILSLLIGFPVFHIPATLTTRIVVACLTVLPAALFAIIGINGESLSSFVINFFVYLKNRRIVGLQGETEETPSKEKNSGKPKKVKRAKPEKKVKPKKEDYAEEFGQFKERRQAKQAADGAAGISQYPYRYTPQDKRRLYHAAQKPTAGKPSAGDHPAAFHVPCPQHPPAWAALPGTDRGEAPAPAGTAEKQGGLPSCRNGNLSFIQRTVFPIRPPLPPSGCSWISGRTSPSTRPAIFRWR